MDAVFLSDIHLTSVEERNGQTLLRFLTSLEGLPKPPEFIFLLGDIFDLWVSNHSVFVKRYRPLLDSLKRLRERGSRVIYFEGNHDMHLDPYFEKVLGAEVHVQAATFKVGGLHVRCEHGDEMNRNDVGYLRLRAVLRHPSIELLAHALPGFFWDQFGQRWSKHSRKHSKTRIDKVQEGREDRIRAMTRAHAEKIWEQEPFDLIVSGHTHVKDDWSFTRGTKEVRSINLGSWIEEPQVLILEQDRLQWKKI